MKKGTMSEDLRPTDSTISITSPDNNNPQNLLATLSPIPNTQTFSQCCVPYLEPLKDRTYQSLDEIEGYFPTKKEINNNTELHDSSSASIKTFPEEDTEKDFRFLQVSGMEIPQFSHDTFLSSYFETSYCEPHMPNYVIPGSTSCHTLNYDHYPRDPRIVELSNSSSNITYNNPAYFNPAFSKFYPFPNIGTSPYGNTLPSQDFSYREKNDRDPGLKNEWKHTFQSEDQSFCSSKMYHRRILRESQQYPCNLPLKSHLNRQRKGEKGSLFFPRNKKSYVASRTKKDFGAAKFITTQKDSSPVKKPEPEGFVSDSPLKNEKSDHQFISNTETSSLNLVSGQSDQLNQGKFITTRPISSSSDSGLSPNLACEVSSPSSRDSTESGPTGSEAPEIANSLWNQVDDVIEEILSLEEGLEAGTDLKKCASQASLQQSQGDNVPGSICDLLGLNGFMGGKTSASCPPDVPKVKTEPKSNSDPQVMAFMKDRQKKDNHNMIERRRRFNINDRIRDLSQLLPKTNEPYHEIVRDIRHNKGQILKASVDYIRRLKSDLEMSKAGEDKRRALEQQNRQLLLRIQELENQLRMNGIKVESTNIDSNLLLPSIAQSEVMSPTSGAASPTTSPFTPISTTSPFTPTPTTSPPLNPIAANFITNTCSSGSDLTDLNFGEEPSITSAETTNLLNDLGVEDPNDVKKVKCPGAHLPDFLLEELLNYDFPENLGFNLMDDESLAFTTSDPMFSSPQVSSPGSSRHSFDDALTPDSMDIVS